MPRKALITALLIASTAAFADTPPPPAPINIPRASSSIKIDGDLSDAAWKTAAVIDKFYETSPSDNIPAKVKTVAYVTYDDKYFYIGIRAEDPNAKAIRAPYVDRDQVIGTDDNIAIFLDTRNDKRTALELRVNPRGIQGDGVFNDGNGSEDFSPDYFYDTAAQIDSGGWSAEFGIPFASLRYTHSDPQTWNILVWRNYPRDFRYGFHSAPLPRGSNCLVCHTHPIVGLTNLPAAGNLVVAPYVTAEQVARPRAGLGSSLRNEPFGKDAGLDLKWTPTATNAVDLTLNPDFSQVEADVAQITTNQRFAVFFPEKRPFFLEGFDLFDTPMQVAYSRTITAPRYGARLTGKRGNAAYTMLVTDDRGGGLTIIPGTLGSRFALQDFKSINAIGRARYDIGRAFVGAVFTDREIRGGGHNRVFGPDFQWRPTDGDSIAAEFLVSDTKTPNRRDLSSSWDGSKATSHAFSSYWNHQTSKYDWFVEARDIGQEFRADLGFIPQVGYREIDGGGGLRMFPENSMFRFVRPNIFIDHQTDRDNNTIFQRFSPGIGVFGVKNLNANAALRHDRIENGNGLRSQTYLSWFAQMDPSRRFTRIVFSGEAGQRIDFANDRVGRGATLSFGPTIRPIDKLTLDITYNREWLDVEGGQRLYTANVQRLRALYSFSSKSLVRVIGQYVSEDRNPALYSFNVARHESAFLGSILYSYKLNWQTVLFVGYGDNRELTFTNDLAAVDRSLFFKLSYAFQR